MFHLAPELVDLIVDNVEASEDLKALSLVCRTFVPNIQWRIFRRLTLASDTLPRLSVVFSASPHIGAYVRDLHINLNIGNSQIHAPLARTLRLLSRVNRVAISTVDWQFWYWNSCPKELHTALISLMSLPTMRCLALVRCCGVPAALIRHAIGAYKEVVLQVADIDFKRKLKFVPSGNGESLRHLVLPDYSPVETPDFHTLMLSDEVKASSTHLQHLEMVIPLRNFEGLDDVIVKHAASLQRLTLVYPYSQHPPIVQLPVLPRLRFLTLRALVPLISGVPGCMMHIMDQLSSLAPGVEVLTFTLSTPHNASTWLLLRPDISRLTLTGLPRLREICFSLCSGDSWHSHLFETEPREKRNLACYGAFLRYMIHRKTPEFGAVPVCASSLAFPIPPF
ncbi:hypothetical protein B0H13DRAFT_875725 [Mycena leptocephala]|nr:hypothetical protein B0H13DRAFT_875725 [Mycena leptocephala]